MRSIHWLFIGFFCLSLSNCVSRKLKPQETQCSEGKVFKDGQCQTAAPIVDPIPTPIDQTPPSTDSWDCQASLFEGRQIWVCDGSTNIAYRCNKDGAEEKKNCNDANKVCQQSKAGVDAECVTEQTPVQTGDWDCARSHSTASGQVWTCNNDLSKRYKCDESGKEMMESCQDQNKVCERKPVGTNDICVSDQGTDTAKTWDCAWSKWGTGQIWTCDKVDQSRAHRCNAGKVETLDCKAQGQRCIDNGLGNPDSCG